MNFASRDGYIVRIFRQGSQIAAGIGFVVADRYVVTCAHVINTALGRDRDVREEPDPQNRFAVDFPILGDADGAPARSSKLVKWMAPAGGLWSEGDVAGLQLVGEGLPKDAGAARLITHESVRDAAVEVFGYPPSPTGRGTSREQGAWARLRLRSAVGGGTLQLDSDVGASWQAQPGYSGSPVVVVAPEGAEAVVGMLVAAVKGGGRDAYAIPVKQIAAAWPEVLGHIVTGGGAISPGQDAARTAAEAVQSQEATPPAAKPAPRVRDFARPFPPTRLDPKTPASLPVQAVPAVLIQPTLPQVIAGSWAIQIQNPMGQITLMLTLAVQPNGQLVFEGFFVGLGESVSGFWGVTNNQVKLVGQRFMGGPWGPRVAYETTVTFASWSHAQLQGTSSENEPVIWRRQA
jgi:hypothetical protein